MKNATKLILAIISFCFLAINTFAQDGTLTNFALAGYIKTNTAYPLTVNVINVSGTNITQFSVSWQLDGGTVNTYGPVGIGGGGLPSSGGYYFPVSLTPSLNTPTQGVHTVKVWVDATGEINRSNDTLTYTVIALTTYSTKVVLLEESTAQWCEHCPPAGEVTDSLSQLSWIAVSRFHNTDDFSFTDDEDYYNRYYGGAANGFFPACEVDMTEMGRYTVNAQYPAWPADAAAQSGISPLALSTSFTIDTATRELTATFTANFKYAEAGNYSFNGFILESGIVSNQTLPDLSTNYSFVHNNLVRALLGGLNGTSGIIPATPVVNTDYTKTYTYTIPAGWVIKNLSLVGVVFNTDTAGNTAAVNAAKTGSLTGINNAPTANTDLKVYPNPTTGTVYFNGMEPGSKLDVYDMLGKAIHSSIATGDSYSINLSGNAKGLYFYRITNNSVVVKQGKVVLE